MFWEIPKTENYYQQFTPLVTMKCDDLVCTMVVCMAIKYNIAKMLFERWQLFFYCSDASTMVSRWNT